MPEKKRTWDDLNDEIDDLKDEISWLRESSPKAGNYLFTKKAFLSAIPGALDDGSSVIAYDGTTATWCIGVGGTVKTIAFS